MSQSLADLFATTALSGGNADFLEDLYEQYLKDPNAVDPRWAEYFLQYRQGGGEIAHGPIRGATACQGEVAADDELTCRGQ